MSAPDTRTWDINPARRPSLDDVGGASLIDNAKYPPDPQTMPYAASLNQQQHQTQGAGSVIHGCAIQVTNDGTTVGVIAFASMGTLITHSTFVVVRNGPGDVSVTWPSGTLPNPIMPAEAYVVAYDTVGDYTYCQPIAITITNGVRVKIYDNNGTLSDIDFVVKVY